MIERMRIFNRLALPIILTTVFAVLVVGYWSELLDYLILPIANLLWQAWRILTSVGQATYWAILLLVCLFVTVRLFPFRKKAPPRRSYQLAPRPPNRMAYWSALFREAQRGKNENEYLRSNLRELFLSMNARPQRYDTYGAEEMIEGARSSLPPAASQYLFPPDSETSAVEAFAPRWLRRLSRNKIQFYGSGLNETLDWMEQELEIHHED